MRSMFLTFLLRREDPKSDVSVIMYSLSSLTSANYVVKRRAVRNEERLLEFDNAVFNFF